MTSHNPLFVASSVAPEEFDSHPEQFSQSRKKSAIRNAWKACCPKETPTNKLFWSILMNLAWTGLLFGIIEMYAINYYTVNDTTPDPINGNMNIVLLGDSLIDFPYTLFNLGGHVHDYLHGYEVNVYNEGVGSDTIQRIRNRLPEVLALQPDTLFLLWDTDCSDTNENDMTSEEVAQTRATYMENVRYVINATLVAGTQQVIVSGPILLGEGPWFNKQKFLHKASMLQDYIHMNQMICEEMNVTYLNLRTRFQGAIPAAWPLSMWMLTFDGEHPNSRGTRMIAQEFTNTLQTMLQ